MDKRYLEQEIYSERINRGLLILFIITPEGVLNDYPIKWSIVFSKIGYFDWSSRFSYQIISGKKGVESGRVYTEIVYLYLSTVIGMLFDYDSRLNKYCSSYRLNETDPVNRKLNKMRGVRNPEKELLQTEQRLINLRDAHESVN